MELFGKELIALAIVTAMLVQALKVALGAWLGAHRDRQLVKAGLAVLPMFIGAALGWLTLRELALELHPAAAGAVAGALSQTVYGLAKPVLSARMQGRDPVPEEVLAALERGDLVEAERLHQLTRRDGP